MGGFAFILSQACSTALHTFWKSNSYRAKAHRASLCLCPPPMFFPWNVLFQNCNCLWCMVFLSNASKCSVTVLHMYLLNVLSVCSVNMPGEFSASSYISALKGSSQLYISWLLLQLSAQNSEWANSSELASNKRFFSIFSSNFQILKSSNCCSS